MGQAESSIGKIKGISLFEKVAVIRRIRSADQLQVFSLTRIDFPVAAL